MSPHSKRYQSLDPKGFERMRAHGEATKAAGRAKPRRRARKGQRRGLSALLHALCYMCSGYGR